MRYQHAREAALRAAYRAASRFLYGSSLHGDWAYEKIQRFGTLFNVAMNFACLTLRIPRIYRPFSVLIEPAFGCNLQCKTCWEVLRFPGDTRPPRMSWDLYVRIVDQLPRCIETITLGYGGEPLLHPQLPDMVDYGARAGKRMIVFTNGTLLAGDVLERLARSDLAVLNVSVETDAEMAREIRGVDQHVLRGNVERFIAGKRPHTEVKLSVAVHEQNVGRLANVYREWGDLVSSIKVSPAVVTGPPGPPKLCTEPWRGNLNVMTNGVVSPCCADFDGSLAIGNLSTQSLDEILRGKAYRDLLRRFLKGDAPDRCLICAEFHAEGIPVRMRKKDLPRPRS